MSINIVNETDDLVAVKNVLASVSDKTGLDRLITGLLKVNPNVVIYSTGGTHAAIAKLLGRGQEKNLVQVSEYTGQPEMQGGLVKTLDFKIYMGLLSETYNPDHQADLKRVKGVAIDMVVVNLYPFKQTVARAECTVEEARANIDIGGPCMVRASAKNFLRVASVTNPVDYDAILRELAERRGKISLETRFKLAKKAFEHTAGYDDAIQNYFGAKAMAEVKKCYNLHNGVQ